MLIMIKYVLFRPQTFNYTAEVRVNTTVKQIKQCTAGKNVPLNVKQAK